MYLNQIVPRSHLWKHIVDFPDIEEIPNRAFLDQTTETRPIVFKWRVMYHHLSLLRTAIHGCSSSIPLFWRNFWISVSLWKQHCLPTPIVAVSMTKSAQTISTETLSSWQQRLELMVVIFVVSTCHTENLFVLICPSWEECLPNGQLIENKKFYISGQNCS